MNRAWAEHKIHHSMGSFTTDYFCLKLSQPKPKGAIRQILAKTNRFWGMKTTFTKKKTSIGRGNVENKLFQRPFLKTFYHKIRGGFFFLFQRFSSIFLD